MSRDPRDTRLAEIRGRAENAAHSCGRDDCAISRADIPWLLDQLHATTQELERVREALKEIDKMPYYTEPVPPEHVTGLVRRFNKALDIARAAIQGATK